MSCGRRFNIGRIKSSVRPARSTTAIHLYRSHTATRCVHTNHPPCRPTLSPPPPPLNRPLLCAINQMDYLQ